MNFLKESHEKVEAWDANLKGVACMTAEGARHVSLAYAQKILLACILAEELGAPCEKVFSRCPALPKAGKCDRPDSLAFSDKVTCWNSYALNASLFFEKDFAEKERLAGLAPLLQFPVVSNGVKK